MQREKLSSRAGGRAWGFEKRLEKEKGSNLARRCWEEMRERTKAGKAGSEWERKRKEFFKERGEKRERIENMREEEEEWFEKLIRKDRKKQREERLERIAELRYNSWYKRVKREGIPNYLKKG